MREWSIQLHLLDEEGNERPADVFTKVVYNLHPTFENPVQSERAWRRLARSASLTLRSLHQAPLYLLKRGLGRV